MHERICTRRKPAVLSAAAAVPAAQAAPVSVPPCPAPGHDFSRIRIHTDARAEDAASAVSQRTALPLLQRQPLPAGPTVPPPSLVPALNLPSDEITLDAEEALSAGNAKMIRLAEAFKGMAAGSPQAYIKMSTTLSDAGKWSSVKEKEERARLQGRMIAARDALTKLGVPEGSVQIEPATVFSSKGAGQITASLYKSPQALPSFGPSVGPPGNAPGTAGGPGPSLGDMLSFRFQAGPVEFAVELPKSVAVKLPVALSAANALAFELKAEASGDFSFSITLDAQPHVRVAAKAAVKVDKDKGTSGSAGLEISTLKTVCNAPSPDALRTKITASGEKLKKAMAEVGAATEMDRVEKLTQIAGAIGEMYDAVEKAKSGCKQVPSATLNLGVQTPLKPKDDAINDPDPNKRPSTYIGGTLTIPF